mgnify:CR=1 FL=1
MNLSGETKRILRAYGIVPKKRLGQNFLVDEETLGKMVSYALLGGEDVILEVGAGLGFLTERLAQKASQVIAVEIDPKLVGILKNRLSSYRNVTILQGDIMSLAVPPFNKVVSTPPYSLSSPLQFWLLEKSFEQAILAFQEEFAERLAAPVGSENYGRLTVTTYFRAGVELLGPIPRELFQPPPRVDSTIVRLKPRQPPFFVEDERMFFDFVRAIFTQKNRKLRNAVMPFLRELNIAKRDADQIAVSLPFNCRRPRELAPEEIGFVVNEIAKALGSRGLI